jgi:hypothetical protein
VQRTWKKEQDDLGWNVSRNGVDPLQLNYDKKKFSRRKIMNI